MQREDWDRKYAETEHLWSLEPNRVLVQEAAGLEPGRALDLACGEGRHAIYLAQLGWRVTAVDFSDVAIAKGRKRAVNAGVEVDFYCADVVGFDPEPGAFDLVLLFFLHLPTKERRVVLARAAGALASGGTFLLVGHDLLNMSQGVGGPSDPDVLYTPEDIVAELPALHIEKAERVLRDVADADRTAIDALVRAREVSLVRLASE